VISLPPALSNALPRALLVALLAAAGLAACTTEEVYSKGQAYQRSLCSRIVDPREYERCMRDADFAYDQYKLRKEEEEKAAADKAIGTDQAAPAATPK